MKRLMMRLLCIVMQGSFLHAGLLPKTVGVAVSVASKASILLQAARPISLQVGKKPKEREIARVGHEDQLSGEEAHRFKKEIEDQLTGIKEELRQIKNKGRTSAFVSAGAGMAASAGLFWWLLWVTDY